MPLYVNDVKMMSGNWLHFLDESEISEKENMKMNMYIRDYLKTVILFETINSFVAHTL